MRSQGWIVAIRNPARAIAVRLVEDDRCGVTVEAGPAGDAVGPRAAVVEIPIGR